MSSQGVKISAANGLSGTICVPGDKSISHRSLLLGSLARGVTEINALLNSEDVLSTKLCMEMLGAKFTGNFDKMLVEGVGWENLKAPEMTLPCGNSGTSIRLLMGVLAALPFDSVLEGDESLCKRPMKRVSDPLEQMGGKIELTEGNYPPISIKGGGLMGIDYELPVASAQVKSAIMLAALQAEGTTTITGKIQSRDHTERMLTHFGAKVDVTDTSITIQGKQDLQAQKITVPGDISSAAFWLVAGSIIPNSRIEIHNVGLNPTRTGILKILEKMGADLEVIVEVERPEPIGKIIVKSAPLKGIEIGGEDIPSLIDEIPVLCVLATFAEGETIIKDAQELRYKECDRIEAVASNLRKMGANVESFKDGMKIKGPQSLGGASIECFNDHRIAMAFSIAALGCSSECTIEDGEVVNISYPTFYSTLKSLVKK
ncbi:MAG: 3-phosphoshikimate 1-carboxyvinyltransferase [Bacteriovoracaceae bacterium]|nr:3-phosphoshikimate 1-carboxyvinyltransferase [Bacteriovoracaceae bacterium]